MTALATHVDTEVIDLESACAVLNNSLDIATALHGRPVGTTRTAKSESTRALLHLADDLQLASQLVRNAYWDARGEESYDL